MRWLTSPGRWRFAGTALLAAGWLWALSCQPRAAPPLTVYAAASLSDALAAVAEGFRTTTGRAVRLQLGPTSRLAKQLQAGAPADLFFSADAAWMDALEEKALTVPGSRVDLLGNELVLIVPSSSSFAPADPAALAAAGDRVGRLALAAEGVPAGRYARAALHSTGALAALSPKLTTADDVRMALAWVARGEADAGVVYATDAKAEPRVKVAFRFAPNAHPPIVYPAAVLRGAADPAAAAAFLTYCQSDEGRALFEAAGFAPLAPRR